MNLCPAGATWRSPQTYHAGLRPLDAVTGGRGLPPRSSGARGDRQPRIKYGAGSEHSPHRVPVRDLPASRSTAHRKAPRVSSHTQTRQLAQPCPEPADGIAEIEFSAFSRSCLKRRNPDAGALQRQITAYETERNATAVTIDWRFSTHDARTKLRRFYPCLSNVG